MKTTVSQLAMMKPGRLSLLAAAVAALVAFLVIVSGKEINSGPVPAPDPERSKGLAISPTTDRAPPEAEADYMRVLEDGLPTPGCEEFQKMPPDVRSNEQASAEWRRSAEMLSSQDDAQLVLAAALMADSARERWRELQRAYELNPRSRLAMWHLLQACGGDGCRDQQLLDDAARLDGDNAAVWLERARAALNAKDWELAERELRRGIAAPRYDIYFAEHVTLLERSLAASSNLNYMERQIGAIGSAAAVAIPAYSDITNACKDESNSPETWVSLCDEFGATMVAGSRTLIDHSIGLALRRIAAERNGDAAKAAEFVRQREQTRRAMHDLMMSGANTLLENDEAFAARYWERFSIYGELAAFQFSIDEAARLRADPTYDQCNFVRRKWPDS